MYPAFLGLLLLSFSTSLANAHETTARCCPKPDHAQQKLFQLSLDAAQMSDASVSLSAVDGDRDGYFARNDRAYFEKMQSLRELLKRHNEVYSLCVSPEIEQPISSRLQIYTRANYSNLPNPNDLTVSNLKANDAFQVQIKNIYKNIKEDRKLNLTPDQEIERFSKILSSDDKNQNPLKKQLLLSYFYRSLLASKNDEDISRVFARARSNISVPDRENYLSLTLNRLGSFYDEVRMRQNFTGKGSVSGLALLQNLNRMESLGPKSNTTKAGVCRDIHLFGARMAEELGLGRPVVKSFADRERAHANLAYHAPNDPLKVTLMNYGHMTRTRGGDVRSLYDGPGDISIEYKLSNPDGSPAKLILSEFGKQMFSFAGADPTTIDPLSENRSSVLGFTLPSTTGTSTTRLAIGQDGNGVVSAALTEVYMPNDTSKASLSLGTSHAQDNTLLENSTVNTDFVFAYLEKNFKSKDQQWTENISSRLEALTQIYLLAGHTRAVDHEQSPDRPSSITLQGGSFLTLKAVTEKKVSPSSPGVKTELGVQTFPAIRDVSNAYWKQVPVLAMNHFFWTAEGRTLLSQSPEGRAFMLAKLTLLFDSLGAKARYEAGIVSDKRGGITALIQGRIYGAAYTDGTRRKTGIAAHLNPNDWLKIGAYSLVDLETQKTEKREINLGASVAVESR